MACIQASGRGVGHFPGIQQELPPSGLQGATLHTDINHVGGRWDRSRLPPHPGTSSAASTIISFLPRPRKRRYTGSMNAWPVCVKACGLSETLWPKLGNFEWTQEYSWLHFPHEIRMSQAHAYQLVLSFIIC